MKTKVAVIGSTFLSLFWGAFAQGADVPTSARPGTVNYVEGEASVGKLSLSARSIGTVEMKPGQSLRTESGKAEILLTPGVFLRLGDTSSAKMISPNLLDTEMELRQGEALVEVAEINKENRLRIVEDGKATDLIKTGLYDFNADRHVVRVFGGKAVVEEGRRLVTVKAGREVDLSGGDPMKATKFDRKVAENEDLYRWASLRSAYLAEANVNAANIYVGGGFGWFGDGWYWDPWFDAFTFIPGDGIFYSPFGWGFYSPAFVYAAPIFYGGSYYRHFGPNRHAWGPGAHYGLPANYGRGVRYGARTGLAGGTRPTMGIYGQGFPSSAGNPRHGWFSRRCLPSLKAGPEARLLARGRRRELASGVLGHLDWPAQAMSRFHPRSPPTCIIGERAEGALPLARLEAGLGRLIAALVASMLSAGFSYQASLNESNAVFESADLVSAKGIPYPTHSIAIGTVVLEATISESGNVEDVRGIREIPSLTDVAIESVKTWHFKPASLGGRPIRSRTAVAVSFNPAAAPVASPALPPLSTDPRSSARALLQPEPVEVLAATLPQYPANSVTTGAVVLRVRIDKSGNVQSIAAVRRIPSLTSQCIRVVKEWKFKPAEFRGMPTPSSIALAFVLRPPTSPS